MPHDEKTDAPVVLITGSGGLIGEEIGRVLSGDYRIVGLDNQCPESAGRNQRWIECDLTDASSVEGALETVRDDFGTELACVIHLAAYYDFSGEPSPLYRKLTVEGTRRLVRGLEERFDVEQIQFASTILVMKPAGVGGVISEDTPLEALWSYPASKIRAETIVRASSIPSVCLRVAGVYTAAGRAVPLAQQVYRIHQKKLESFFFPGDPEHAQPFVHLDDVVTCVARAVERRRDLGRDEVFLVGEEDLMSYEELQDRVGELLHEREWPTVRIPSSLAKAGAWVKEKIGSDDEFIKPWMIDLADAHYPICIERARKKLDWEPARRLRDELEEIIAALRSDPEAWYAANGLPREEPTARS